MKSKIALVALVLIATFGALPTALSLSTPTPDFEPITITPPTSITGQWITDHESAAKFKTFTYAIATDGTVQSDLAEFKRQVAETLSDSRGWIRANIKFKEVSSSPQFTIYLSEPARVGAYSGCSSDLSCRSGNRVMINDDRWRLATVEWNATGSTLRDYRHLVVNHEVGHWLGHPHLTHTCSAPTQLAPLMIDSFTRHDTCAPNAWPLNSELWTSR